MAEPRYFFSSDGTVSYGPVTIAALRRLVDDRVLTASSYLRAEGQAEWQEIDLDFFLAPAAPVAPVSQLTLDFSASPAPAEVEPATPGRKTRNRKKLSSLARAPKLEDISPRAAEQAQNQEYLSAHVSPSEAAEALPPSMEETESPELPAAQVVPPEVAEPLAPSVEAKATPEILPAPEAQPEVTRPLPPSVVGAKTHEVVAEPVALPEKAESPVALVKPASDGEVVVASPRAEPAEESSLPVAETRGPAILPAVDALPETKMPSTARSSVSGDETKDDQISVAPASPPDGPKVAPAPARKTKNRPIVFVLGFLVVLALLGDVAFVLRPMFHRQPSEAQDLARISAAATKLKDTVNTKAQKQIQAKGYFTQTPAEATKQLNDFKKQVDQGKTDTARIAHDLLVVVTELSDKTKQCDEDAKACDFDVLSITGRQDIALRREAIEKLHNDQEAVVTFLQNIDSRFHDSLAADHFSEATIHDAITGYRQSGDGAQYLAFWQEQAKLSADHLARFDFLAKTWGTWTIKDGKFIFQDPTSLEAYNWSVHELLSDVQALRTTQSQIYQTGK